MKTVTFCGIDIDIYDKIGVSHSGGADSTLLLYMLMSVAKDPIHIFTTGNNQRYRRNVEVSTRVVEWLINETGNSNIEHHISYTDVQSAKTLWPKLSTYKKAGMVDIIYTGITANPPKEVTDEFTVGITETNRTPETQRPTKFGIFYTPFTNFDKSKIAEIYKDLELGDLFNLTRSCEFDPTTDPFDPGLGHCGRCWWCQEREWAFGELYYDMGKAD